VLLFVTKATFSQMPPDELQKRQKYLQEQRQKLTAMKQKVNHWLFLY